MASLKSKDTENSRISIELKSYLDSQGIAASNFNCKHYEECKGNNDKFTEAKEAYIGTEYEKNRLPRVLFVSLDSGSSDAEPEKRTMEAMRDWEQTECEPLTIETPHWYETHELAWRLLRKYDPSLQLKDICPYFAHTNSAKCCQNKDGRAQADNRLFENCREYLPKEIEILDPDIIVTQGEKARWVIEWGIYKNDSECHKMAEPLEVRTEGCPESRIRGYSANLISVGEKKVIWLSTYHPAARPFNLYQFQKTSHFERWAEVAYEYLTYHGWGSLIEIS